MPAVTPTPIQPGQQFGRLTTFGKFKKAGWRTKVLTRCDCGRWHSVRLDTLKSGGSRSCGCLSREKVKERSTKHGQHGTRTYKSWTQMIQRCTNPNAKGYPRYGGRGITVCDRWLESFENFLEDMGERPPGMTLERLDVNGNYEPGNCTWATWKEQSRNRRTNRLIEFEGETLCMEDVAAKLGISSNTLRDRIKRNGIEAALAMPRGGFKGGDSKGNAPTSPKGSIH